MKKESGVRILWHVQYDHYADVSCSEECPTNSVPGNLRLGSITSCFCIVFISSRL